MYIYLELFECVHTSFCRIFSAKSITANLSNSLRIGGIFFRLFMFNKYANGSNKLPIHFRKNAMNRKNHAIFSKIRFKFASNFSRIK